MKAWCSGRGGLPAGGGRGFDSLRPRCRDLTRKIVEMGAGAGQWGPPPIKKILFFLVKIPIFSGFYRFQLCRVPGFAVTFFGECCSPSVTLGEPFAECFMPFAECFGHSANSRSPVVRIKTLPFCRAIPHSAIIFKWSILQNAIFICIFYLVLF